MSAISETSGIYFGCLAADQVQDGVNEVTPDSTDSPETSYSTMEDLTSGMTPKETKEFNTNIQNSFSSTLSQMQQDEKDGEDAIKQSIQED